MFGLGTCRVCRLVLSWHDACMHGHLDSMFALPCTSRQQCINAMHRNQSASKQGCRRQALQQGPRLHAFGYKGFCQVPGRLVCTKCSVPGGHSPGTRFRLDQEGGACRVQHLQACCHSAAGIIAAQWHRDADYRQQHQQLLVSSHSGFRRAIKLGSAWLPGLKPTMKRLRPVTFL